MEGDALADSAETIPAAAARSQTLVRTETGGQVAFRRAPGTIRVTPGWHSLGKVLLWRQEGRLVLVLA